jgi:MoaA/NifB/PqqE/SkfB family radical SAM enzyme
MRWIEISPGFACNLRCVGCLPDEPPEAQMSIEDILSWLRRARADGATRVWFGGGEPMMRRDILKLVALSRRLGFEHVKLQTNGLAFARPGIVERAVKAGVTSVNLALRSHLEAVHDGLVLRRGAHAALARAIERLAPSPIELEGDILVYRANQAQLEDTVRHYLSRGIDAFNFWYACRLHPEDGRVVELIPRYEEAVPHIVEATRVALQEGARQVISLHTPACVVPRDYWTHLYHPPDLELLVVNADGRSFWLEESPMEGGAPLPSCARCVRRGRCLGPRPDYLDIHGASEFVPIS